MNKTNELLASDAPPTLAATAIDAARVRGSGAAPERHACRRRAACHAGAVSHQVKALEHWLDAKLVQREGRRIVLTTAGAAYAPSLSTALDLMADATRSLQRPPAASASRSAPSRRWRRTG